MAPAVGSIDPMTGAGLTALLAEATAVRGWAGGGWRWRSTATSFELLGALPPVTEPDHRELMLIGGASLLNLRLLTRVLGLHPAVQTMPNPAAPELIAVLRPEGLRSITTEDRLLAAGIAGESRGSIPPAGQPAITDPMPDDIRKLLRRAAKVEHGFLALVSMDRLPFAIDPAGGSTMGGIGTAAVIGTVLDGPVARLQAGQAMQRVLLTAAVNGLAARPVPAVLGEPNGRAALRELIGGGLWPQAVLQLDDRSPRRR
ncbi:MAG: hypothetical protein ABWZ98_01580 [Nakamurella sp.]